MEKNNDRFIVLLAVIAVFLVFSILGFFFHVTAAAEYQGEENEIAQDTDNISDDTEHQENSEASSSVEEEISDNITNITEEQVIAQYNIDLEVLQETLNTIMIVMVIGIGMIIGGIIGLAFIIQWKPGV